MISTELFMQAHQLVTEWEGKENQNVPADVISNIFNVHNQIYPNAQEYSKSCGGCRQRTWTKLKDWYHNNKHLYGY